MLRNTGTKQYLECDEADEDAEDEEKECNDEPDDAPHFTAPLVRIT